MYRYMQNFRVYLLSLAKHILTFFQFHLCGWDIILILEINYHPSKYNMLCTCSIINVLVTLRYRLNYIVFWSVLIFNHITIDKARAEIVWLVLRHNIIWWKIQSAVEYRVEEDARRSQLSITPTVDTKQCDNII